MPDKQPQKVKFRHPATGGEAHGHVHTAGKKGATVLDEEGSAHRVPHGHYMHHAPELDAKAVAKHAAQHLQLGPLVPLAVYAAISLLAMGGIEHPHDLKASEITVKGDKVLVHRGKKRVTDPDLVDVLSHLAGASEEGPLFVLDGTPVEAAEVDSYVKRFGASKGQQMAKASALAIRPPTRSPKPDQSWLVNGYTCEYRIQGRGIGILTLRKASMAMPLHEVVGGLRDAHRTANEWVNDLTKGELPKRGIMAVDGR